MACTPRTAAVNTITVAVRKRPKIIPKESEENDVVRCEGSTTIVVYEPKTKLDLTPVIEPNVFSFDHVFDDTASNADVYETCCRPLLQDVKEGGGAVIFAFGQTGSGKTHTMLGRAGVCQGLYGFTVSELLTTGAASSLVVSFYEVYGAKLFDLLNGRAAVKMLQDEFRNIHIVGLSEREVSTEEELRQLMSEGQMLRASGITHANDRSSRSHAVLGIKVRMEKGGVQCGRITFVDLAGSERAADTADADIKVRREGAEINKSLLALKECIRAMSMRKRHIPFRASKLTQILSESFTGRCKTCVIANISPCQRHCEDTLNTLRYAHRIKELKCPTNDMFEHEVPTPCPNCGLPVFIGDKHVCLRMNVQCPHCRQEMDKQDLEAHLRECKDFPIRCPYCNEHLFRGELVRHNRRCVRFPVRCPFCSSHVLRNALEKHVLAECASAKVKCRYCGEMFPKHSLVSHELDCDMMKVACSFCLQYVRKGRLETHTLSCWKNPNRKVVPTPVRSESNLSVAHSTEVDSRMSKEREQQGVQQQQQQQQQEPQQQQRRLVAARVPRQLKLPRRSVSTCNGDGPSSSSSPSPSRARSDAENVCPYARYGCNFVVTDSNLSTHLSDAVAKHLRLVSVYADRMDVENAALRRLVVTNNSKAPEIQ